MKTRFRPTKLTESIRVDELNLDCFYSTETMTAIMYTGRAFKPLFYVSFRTVEQMNDYIYEKINVLKECNKAKKRAQAIKQNAQRKLNALDHFKEGDIVYNSWGYEQTNIEFYQVVKVLTKSIEVQEVYQNEVEGSRGVDCCSVLPVKNKFIEGSMPFQLRLRISVYNEKANVHICNPKSYYYFSKHNGQPKYKSWYY